MRTIPAPELVPSPFSTPPDAPRGAGLRLGIVVTVTLALVAVLASTLPTTAYTARRAAYPQPHLSITTDASSSSRVQDPIHFTATEVVGRDLTYEWDFGDGQRAQGQAVSHTFSAYQQGGYQVSVTARDPLSQSASAAINVTVLPQPPQACFTSASDPNGATAIDFDASCSTGAQLSYRWDFGDGSGDQGQQVNNDYVRPGTYTVTLRVVDVAGQQSSVTHQVQVTVAAPVARFTAKIDTFSNCYVDFDASTSVGYGYLRYSWSFGDGHTETNDYFSSTYEYYPFAGNYFVQLTVTDQFGQTGTIGHSVYAPGC